MYSLLSLYQINKLYNWKKEVMIVIFENENDTINLFILEM